MKNNPKVSILCLTYNHEKYIEQALNSFISQKTIFNFEVLVHDDASTDKTIEIIKKYQKKYPNIIRPIFQDKNQFSKKNCDLFSKYLIPHAKGKYFAICEGDDYWSNSNKLQIAVDTLDNNPDCIMFVHNTIVQRLNNKELLVKLNPKYIDNKFSLANSIYTHTSARVFRKMERLPPGDIFQYHYLLSKGLCYYHNKPMSVYRYNESGIWSSISQEQQKRNNIKCLYLLNIFFKWKYNDYYLSQMPYEINYYKEKFPKKNSYWIAYLISQKYTLSEMLNYEAKYIKIPIIDIILWKIFEIIPIKITIPNN